MPSSTSTSKGRWCFVRRKLPSDGTHAPITEDLKRTGEARRRGAAELAHAERELQLTLDTIPTLVWQTRADGFAEYFNKRWLDYTGLSMEQALGWNWQVAIHPDDHRALLDSWRGILATEKPAADAGRQRRFEARLRRFDGAYRWFLFRPAPFRDERGRLIRWYGTNTDIEYQKRAESALQVSETLLAEAQKLSHTGSFGWNVSTNEIFWSEETYRIFDYEPGTNITIDMALGRVHPDDRAHVEQAIERAKTQKEAFDLEHRLQLPNGAVKNLHVVAHALVDEPQKLQLAGAVMDITARKQADQALRQSESRYQTLFQAMAVSFFEVDYTSRRQMLREVRDAGVTDFRRYFKENPGFIREIMQATHIVDVNDQTVALFGRGSKDEFLTSVEPFWPEESYQDYAEAVLASIERSRAFSVETRMRKLDGTIFDAHFTLRYASEDRTRGVVGVIDITARKQAEQTLRDSEARLAEAERELRLTLDSIPAITWRGGPNGNVQSLNKRWFEYTGTTPEQVRGARWKSCIHPDDLARLVEAGTKYVASGKAIDAEARLRRFDGEYRWFLFRSAPARDESGNIIGWYGTITDIEERKQAEAALRQSEQRFRLLFQNMPVALWQLNTQQLATIFGDLRAQGVIDLSAFIDKNPAFLSKAFGSLVVEEVNDYAVRLSGARDRNELLGPSNWTWAKSIDTFRRAMESRWRGEEFYQETTKLVRRDGRIIDVLFTAARPQTIEDLSVSLIGVIDLTEQVRAQAELQQVRADFAHAARVSMLGELTASIAHEVNQPLGAIAAGGEASLRWLARSTPDVDEVRELTKRVVVDARRASEIVARIRGMATRRIPEQTLLSLDDVIREALVFLRHEVESRGVAVSHVSSLVSQKVFADRTQLQQVIANLAVNAVQAMAQAGSANRYIIIRTVTHDTTTVRCSVEDSGPGIEPQHVTRLFDSFFTTKDSGMGMGLRICRSVIEAHGGRIAADNESSEGGARFFFTLPVASTD